MTDATSDPEQQETDMATTDYDPSEHTNDEVLAHAQASDPDEVQRVLELEQAGRARVGILRELDPNGEAELVTVKLRHHWTDARGTAHLPGDEPEVPTVVADALVAGHYADRLDAEGDTTD